jgi:hypothetical protein
MRRVAVLSAAVLGGVAVLAPSSALATGSDDRWIAVEDHFAVVLPNGETFGNEDPPMEGENGTFAPPVGTRLFISEALYETDDGRTRGDAAGRTYIECTAQAVPAHLLCDIAFVLDDGSQLHGSVVVDFTPESATEQFRLDIAVTGGSGDYSDASGVVSLLDISADVEGDETVTLYEPDLG